MMKNLLILNENNRYFGIEIAMIKMYGEVTDYWRML